MRQSDILTEYQVGLVFPNPVREGSRVFQIEERVHAKDEDNKD
jgi:hypothetical protein